MILGLVVPQVGLLAATVTYGAVVVLLSAVATVLRWRD